VALAEMPVETKLDRLLIPVIFVTKRDTWTQTNVTTHITFVSGSSRTNECWSQVC